MKLHSTLIAASVAGLLLTATLSAQNIKPAVVTAPVMAESLAATRPLQGTVVPTEEARLATRRGGRIASLSRLGARVGKGDVVARLDSSVEQLVVSREEARLTRLIAERDLADRQVARMNTLTDAIPAAQRDEALARYEVLSAQVEEARVAVRMAELDLSEMIVRAPFAGVVSAELKQTGEQAVAGEALVQLTNTERVEVELSVPVEIAHLARPGDRLGVTASQGDGLAPLRALVPGPAQSRQLRARLALDAHLRDPIGAALKVRWPSAKATATLTVPADAIVRRAEGIHLIRVADGIAHRVPVTLGVQDGQRIAVTGVLKEGDQVVIRGAERLEDGTAVQVTEPEQLAARLPGTASGT